MIVASADQIDRRPGCCRLCECQLPRAMYQIIEERVYTRDRREGLYDETGELNGWKMHPEPPPGVGWEIIDDTHDRRTTWRRWILISLPANEGTTS